MLTSGMHEAFKPSTSDAHRRLPLAKSQLCSGHSLVFKNSGSFNECRDRTAECSSNNKGRVMPCGSAQAKLSSVSCGVDRDRLPKRKFAQAQWGNMMAVTSGLHSAWHCFMHVQNIDSTPARYPSFLLHILLRQHSCAVNYRLPEPLNKLATVKPKTLPQS